MTDRRLLLVLAALVALFFTIPDARSEPEHVRVARVIDGDTFEATDGRRIRLCGVDAPELRNIGGMESMAFLERLIYGQALRCVRPADSPLCIGDDRSYERHVRQCALSDGQDVSTAIAVEGFGRWQNDYLRLPYRTY